MDFLKSAVASAIAKGPLAGYSIAERVDVEDSLWTLNNCAKREDGSRCSVFTFDANTHKKQLPLARNAFRKYRTLRHPGVVKVLETFETDTQLFIITERLQPLSWYSRRKSLTEETIKWGLWNVAKTVKFINEDAASVHACLRISSVYTNESGEWKLGGFELLSSIRDEEAVVHAYTGLLPGSSRCVPPEVAKSGWGTYKQNPWTAVDSWGYANLISELFGGPPSGPAQPSELKGLPPSMQQTYKRLLNPNPKLRPSVASFIDQGRKSGGYFQTALINLTDSMESLGLKSEGEREEFLSELHETADDFPEEFVKQKILPELLNSVEFGGGGPKVLAVILRIGEKLTEEEFASQLTPAIVRLFSSPDRALRVCLLDSLSSMIDHLPQKIVNDKIFPNLTTGFTDVVPVVREQTVKAVLVIIPKLSDRTINGELLKHLAKTANDQEPGIRTNTTICLGKIAKYLGTNTRNKVLVAAFTRSLRDPFVHARNAGLMALAATVEMYSEDDCANRVLPALCPPLLDKEKLVRDQANRVLDIYVNRVRKHAQTLPESTLQAPSASAPTELPNGGSRSGTPRDSSWAGWAVSSFTNKLAAADGSIEPNAKVTVKGSGHNAASKSNQSSSQANLHPVRATQKPVLPRQSSQTSELAQSFKEPELAANEDVWGGMDQNGVDDFDEDAWGAMEDENNSVSTPDPSVSDSFFDTQTSTSTRSSTATARTTTSTSTAAFDDKGEPDFAGWLKAQQSSKSKKGPLPKGIISASKPPVAQALPRPSSEGKIVNAPARKVINPATVTKPASSVSQKPEASQEELEDDDWGDAWT